MDDIIVFGKDPGEHNTHLEEVLKRIQSAGVTLNLQKCEFSKSSLKYLGHIIDEKGIQADPDKTTAIQEMEPSKTVSELRCFLGKVNQFPRNASFMQPLRELLNKRASRTWNFAQDQAFDRVKLELSKPTVLALYDPDADTKITADAQKAVSESTSSRPCLLYTC